MKKQNKLTSVVNIKNTSAETALTLTGLMWTTV